MRDSKWQWLAEICVPAGNDKYRISTGVPVSRRYILTTGHGIPEVDEKPKCNHVQIRFIHDIFHNNGEWRSAKVVWHDAKLDAALLEFNGVEDLLSFIYTASLPTSNTDWEGAGFPAADKIDVGELEGHRDSKGLSGKFLSGGNQKKLELELTIEAGLKEPGKWAGISGAPVLCDGKLIGIIKSLPEEFGGNRLSAIPLWRLLDDASFQAKLGLEDREALLTATKTKAEQLLENAPEVLNALHDQKGMQGVEKAPRPVVDKLFKLAIGDFSGIINRARKSEHIRESAGGIVLDKLLNLVLPHLFDYSVITSARHNIRSGVLVRLPVATRTVAEILMAGVDLRSTAFRKPVSGDKFPVGHRLIEDPPEMGIAADALDKVAAFETMFKKKFVSEEDLNRNLGQDEIRGLINDELDYLAEESGSERHRFYYICENADSLVMQKVIELLRHHYNRLVFIFLQGNALRQERRWARPLREIYQPKTGDAE